MRRGCNDCTVGTDFLSGITRFDSPDDAGAPGRLSALFGALKAKPPVFSISGGFAVDALMHVARKCLMAGRNWSRIKQRSLMHRPGVEDVKGGTPIVAPPVNKQPRRQLTKAEL